MFEAFEHGPVSVATTPPETWSLYDGATQIVSSMQAAVQAIGEDGQHVTHVPWPSSPNVATFQTTPARPPSATRLP